MPSIAFGGPETALDDPSPESVKITDSLVILELLAELYPSSGLMPEDPVQRAQVRFFLERLRNARGSSGGVSAMVNSLVELQGMLSPDGLAFGEKFTIADAALAPFLHSIYMLSGQVLEGPEAKEMYATVFKNEKFARLQKYWADISARDSWKKVVDEVSGRFSVMDGANTPASIESARCLPQEAVRRGNLGCYTCYVDPLVNVLLWGRP